MLSDLLQSVWPLEGALRTETGDNLKKCLRGLNVKYKAYKANIKLMLNIKQKCIANLNNSLLRAILMVHLFA